MSIIYKRVGRRRRGLKTVGSVSEGCRPGAGKQPTHLSLTHSNASDSCIMFFVIRFALHDNNLIVLAPSLTLLPAWKKQIPGGSITEEMITEFNLSSLNLLMVFSCFSPSVCLLHLRLCLFPPPWVIREGDLVSNCAVLFRFIIRGSQSHKSHLPPFCNFSI